MNGERLRPHLARVRQELRAQSLLPRKRFGQHFLLTPEVLLRIAGAAGDLHGRTVIEVGSGPGGLTAALLDLGARVVALEVDPDFAEFLESCFGDDEGFEIRCQDARQEGGQALNQLLEESCRQDGRPPLFVSNLPYQIASVLLVDLVRAPTPPEQMVVTIQAEVARRILAPPGSPERGLLTLLVGLCAESKRLFRLTPGQFTPPPKVSSAVVQIRPRQETDSPFQRLPRLEALLKAAFEGRRKMLRRSLARMIGPDILATLDPELLTRRPQEINDQEWLALAATVGPKISSQK